MLRDNCKLAKPHLEEIYINFPSPVRPVRAILPTWKRCLASKSCEKTGQMELAQARGKVVGICQITQASWSPSRFSQWLHSCVCEHSEEQICAGEWSPSTEGYSQASTAEILLPKFTRGKWWKLHLLCPKYEGFSLPRWKTSGFREAAHTLPVLWGNRPNFISSWNHVFPSCPLTK